MPEKCTSSFFLWLVFYLLAAMLPDLHAASSQVVISNASVRPVLAAVQMGPNDPHRPYIKRAVLQPAEIASEIRFEVALKMRNFAELQARIAKGELIPPEEMAAKYYPLQADYQAVAAWITSQGFKITRQDDNRLAIFATADVGTIQKALRVNFASVSLEGKDYISAINAPSIPATVAPLVVSINGLQPHIRAHRHSVRKQATPDSLINTSQPYLPSQILHAYSANALGLTGSGQAIAIVIDTFPKTSDLTTFWSTYGVAQSGSNISYLQVVPGTLPPPSGEESLDVEWSSSIAPQVKVRIYAATDLSEANLDVAYQQIFTDAVTHPEYGIHQMSMSYGLGETYSSAGQVSTDSQYFANLASAGITIFASTGDGGNDPGELSPDDPSYTPGPVQEENPASDPSVTGVGGTSLTLTSGSNINTETAWAGSGGGTSIFFNRPAWQVGTGVPGGTTRCLPDISAPADPNEGAYVTLNGVQNVFGGTSWSSPTWAGFCALINQARAKVNLPAVGLLGPKIYPLIGTANFQDITSGSNGFNTTAGYDLVTGIGSPNMQNLVKTLVGLQTTPGVATITPGQSATFTVASGSAATSYQWQRMPIGSSTWTNVTAGGIYTGLTTASLTVNGATLTMSGDQFQCLVTTSGTVATTTPPSVLVVDNQFTITTLAGQVLTTGTADGSGTNAQFGYPSGIALDSSGNMYIADFNNNTIRKVTPAGVVTTPYGRPGVSGTLNGSGTNALFNTPNAVAIDGSNNIYVADSGNSTIRKITPAGAVTTLAGKGTFTGTSDGTGSSARFNNPQGIAVDISGSNIYVADTVNDTIRKVTASGVVTTLAGAPGISGYANASGTSARFSVPIGVAVDKSGNVYVSDLFNYVVRKITPAGAVTTPYGQAGVTGRLDGIGANTLFNAPLGIAIDASGNIYIGDSQVPPASTSNSTGNNILRRINTAGVVSTIAGTPGVIGSADGTGPAAQFFSLQAVGVGSSGGIYLADTFNQTVRLAGVPPAIITSPSGLTVIEGNPATFTVSASGVPFPGYQWQRSPAGSGTWSNMIDISGTYAGSTTGTLNVTNTTLTMNGDQFQCVASNGFLPNVTSNTATLTVETGYNAWASGLFGAQFSNSSISGPSATPQNDGIPNSLKYLTDINPSIPMSTAGYAALPTVGVVTITGTQYLTLTYRQNQNIPGLAVAVQTGTDLHAWQTVTPYSIQTTGTDSSTGDPIIQIEVQSAGGQKMFIRLNVTVF